MCSNGRRTLTTRSRVSSSNIPVGCCTSIQVFAGLVNGPRIAGIPIAQLARWHVQALVARGSGFFYEHRFEVVGGGMKHGLPTLSNEPEIVREAGALIAYFSDPGGARSHTRQQYRPDSPGRKACGHAVAAADEVRARYQSQDCACPRACGPKELLLRADDVIQ